VRHAGAAVDHQQMGKVARLLRAIGTALPVVRGL
jgi:hypothetical protein